jgi:hypothetical protein
MSRFERRLKPEKYSSRTSNTSNNSSSSPRPGTATCKLRTNKQKMLSGFISVEEKSSNNQVTNLKQNKRIIEEIEQTKMYETEDDMINRVMIINEQLKISMKNTNNQTLKKLLAHELRLNMVELNLDCLTNLKCTEVSKSQENRDEVKGIEDTIIKVNKFDEIVTTLNLANNKIKSDIKNILNVQEEIQNISLENKSIISEKLNILEEIQREINDLNKNDSNENDNNETEKLNQEIINLKNNNTTLKENLERMKKFINFMVDKFNNKDIEHFDELVL